MFIRTASWLLLLPLTGLAQSSPVPVCPFTAAQVSAAFGAKVSEGQPGRTDKFGGMTMQDCRYQVKAGRLDFTLMVQTTHYGQSGTAEEHFRMMAGKLTPVPGDKDGARVQTAQGDMTTPAVHYFRQGVGVQLRILGVYYEGMKATESELAAWQKKLLALPRIP